MAIDKIDHQALDRLLDELDIRARTQQPGDRSNESYECQRRHPRTPFRIGCQLRYFPTGSSTVGTLAARTRNLSRNGIGLLVRRVFAKGEPVELKISIADRPDVYMAGLATFCRYAGQGFYELGLSLRTASSAPIFSKHPDTAIRSINWLRDAVLHA